MKSLRSILTAGFALALFSSTLVRAETFPIFEDAAGSTVTNVITKAAGSAKTLTVSARSNAYINFAVSAVQGDVSSYINPASVTAARLVIFVPKASAKGTLSIKALTSGFTETITTPNIPAPTIGNTLDSIDLAQIPLKGDYFISDITVQMKAWLTNPSTEFGIAITSDGVATATLASKEGAATGHPAFIELDVNRAGGAVSGTNANFTGDLNTAGKLTSTGTFAGNRAYFGTSTGGFVSSFAGTLEVRGGNATGSGNLRITGAGLNASLDMTPFDPFAAGGTPGARIQATDDGAFSAHLDLLTKTPGNRDNPLGVRMRIASNGNVGIGTTAPGAKLDVDGLGQMQGLELRGATNSYIDFSADTGADFNARLIYPGSGDNRLVFQGAPVTFEPNVGIGTATPTQARLVVLGSAGANTYSKFTSLFDTGTFVDSDGAANLAASIYADGQVHAPVFIAFSDARIKNIVGHSNATADLDTLRKIEITDYTHKDTVTKGSGPVKKVIAQQVETVFPQAVSKSTDVIPDIMKSAPEHDGWITLATDLKVGDRVRIVGEKAEGILAVSEVREGAFRTSFQPEGDKVFVYGREVNDFRAVDYDAIAMLNVSATQELARKLDAKDAEIAALKAANVALAEKLAAFDRQLAALKTDRHDRPASTVRASLAR